MSCGPSAGRAGPPACSTARARLGCTSGVGPSGTSRRSRPSLRRSVWGSIASDPSGRAPGPAVASSEGFMLMGVLIRAEAASEEALIREVNRLAFGGDDEDRLVEALRDGGYARI